MENKEGIKVEKQDHQPGIELDKQVFLVVFLALYT